MHSATNGQFRTEVYSETQKYLCANEKATRQQAAFSSRENSSNGGKSVKTFWRNLMSRKSRVSRNFSIINTFVFKWLEKASTINVSASTETKISPEGVKLL